MNGDLSFFEISLRKISTTYVKHYPPSYLLHVVSPEPTKSEIRSETSPLPLHKQKAGDLQATSIRQCNVIAVELLCTLLNDMTATNSWDDSSVSGKAT